MLSTQIYGTWGSAGQCYFFGETAVRLDVEWYVRDVSFDILPHGNTDWHSSKDLIHWSEQREIKVMKDSLTNNVWAPEVFYDDEKEQFIVAWSSAIPVERYTAADSVFQGLAID